MVTAQKRSENLQRTPVAVTAVASDALTRAGVNDFEDLTKVAPDVQVSRDVTGEQVQIRGVVTTDVSPAAESKNAVFIDGGYFAKAQAIEGQFYDLQRIEVLKGPQGTLYGRNATGGAVNLITNKPTQTFGGQAEFEIGNYDLIRAEGALNVPLTSTLAARAAFQSYSHSGYETSGLQDADEKGGRLEFLWKPDNRQSLFLSGDVEKIGGQDPGGYDAVAKIPGATGALTPGGVDLTTYAPRNNKPYYGDGSGYFSSKVRQYGLNAQYDYTFDWATATFQINHRSLEGDAWVPAGSPVGGTNHAVLSFNDTTAEARLTSVSTTPLQWVGGVFVLAERDRGLQTVFSSLTNRTFFPLTSPKGTTPLGAYSVDPATGVVTIPGAGPTFGNPYERANSYAVYGQATYTPAALDILHLILGARYTIDHKVGITYSQLGAPDPVTGVTAYLGGASPQRGKRNWHAFTYRAGLSLDVTSTSMLYGSISTGYKPGGFAFGPYTATTSPIYNPEHITAYEVGMKNRFFDNRLQVNVEAYLYHYRDFEENVLSYVPIVTLSITNAGRATFKGIAVEAQYAVTDHDRLAVNATTSSARYGDNTTISQNLTGTAILDVPRTAGTASYDHTWEALGGMFDAQASVFYRGRTPLAIANANTPAQYMFTEGSWAQYDLSLRYASGSEHNWSVTAYVHNLTNGAHINDAGYSNNAAGIITGEYMAPRTYGFIFKAAY